MRTSPWYGRSRNACWSYARRRETSCGSMVEMPSGACASMTGLQADPEVHHDAAITCPQRLYATGINASSGPEQPEAVGKAPRDSAYPTTRTGPKGAPGGLPGADCRPWHAGRMPGRDRSGCGSCRAASELSRTLKSAVRDRDGGRQRPGARLSYTGITGEGKGLTTFASKQTNPQCRRRPSEYNLLVFCGIYHFFD